MRWIGLMTCVVYSACTVPCPPPAEPNAKLTLLVTDVARSSKGILRITALALNASPNVAVAGQTTDRLSQSWTEKALGREVSFLVEGDDTIVARDGDPPGDVTTSNRITVSAEKVEVERPAPDLFFVQRSEFNTVTLLVPGALPEGVHLFNGRGNAISQENYECLPSATPWLKTVVSECSVFLSDPRDAVGFRGEQVQATIDTPSGPVRTRTLKVR